MWPVAWTAQLIVFSEQLRSCGSTNVQKCVMVRKNKTKHFFRPWTSKKLGVNTTLIVTSWTLAYAFSEAWWWSRFGAVFLQLELQERSHYHFEKFVVSISEKIFKKWQEKPTRPPGSSLGYVRVTWKGGRGVLVPIWLEFECAWLILNTVRTLMQPQKKQLKSFLLSLAKDTNIKIQLSCAGYIGGHINGGKCFVKDIFLFHVFFFFGITKLYIFGCKGTAISFISFPRCNFVNTSPLVR